MYRLTIIIQCIGFPPFLKGDRRGIFVHGQGEDQLLTYLALHLFRKIKFMGGF